MNPSTTRSVLFILALVFCAFGRASAAAPQEEIDAISDRIVAKAQAGQNTEADLARELNQLSDLYNKYRSQKAIASAVLLARAQVYEQVIKDREMALILYEQVATEYPGTPAGYIAASTVEAARATADDAPRTRAQSREKTPSTRSNSTSSARQSSTGSRSSTPARVGSTPQVGSMFPDFSVQDLDGAPLSISQFRGQVVLVDFWATWCGPCVAELDNVMAAYRKYHDKGFEIVGISLDHARAPLVNFIRKRTITWPQYYDEDGALGRRYGVTSIPATFLLDREGKIVAVNLRGAALDRALAKYLEP